MLRIESLHAGYDGAEVLHGVSLEVKDESVALLGANGAGKTTMLMAVSGIVPITKGDILLDGVSVRRLKPDAIIQKGIAHVPEGRRIFPELTVAENLRLGARLVRDRRRATDEIDRVMELFPILRARYHSPGGILSGGEQQMLAIARGLASSPRLLIIDEPSLGLSPVAAEKIFDLLSQIAREGISLLIVEQDVELALQIAKKVYVMESGRIVLSGPAEQLASDPRLADAYLGTNRW
jgi:branched-chain amino acid transport system ATP-binding protein